jgi:hypothetical protein
VTSGEAMDNEGVTLGEDTVVECAGLLCSHDQGEAGTAALPNPFY